MVRKIQTVYEKSTRTRYRTTNNKKRKDRTNLDRNRGKNTEDLLGTIGPEVIHKNSKTGYHIDLEKGKIGEPSNKKIYRSRK